MLEDHDVTTKDKTVTSPADLRCKQLMVITRRLIIFAAISVFAIALIFSLGFSWGKRVMLSWLAFGCGLLGGFVSIQQRLRKIDGQELTLLTESWFTILIIPVFGAIFAEILYILFLSGLLQGHMFPSFYIPPFDEVPTVGNVIAFLRKTYPKSGADMAKLMFWTFVAGFSERFVPQIVSRISSKAEGEEEISSNGRDSVASSESNPNQSNENE